MTPEQEQRLFDQQAEILAALKRLEAIWYGVRTVRRFGPSQELLHTDIEYPREPQ